MTTYRTTPRDLREALAAYVHDTWSDTDDFYTDLPDEAKEVWCAEADKVLEICRQHAPLKFTGWYLGKRAAVKDVIGEARSKLKRQDATRELDVADVLDALEEAGLLR